MIYNKATVYLAGLISMASAASVQHASKSHDALVAPGHASPMALSNKKINKDVYTEACYNSWKTFDEARCWCYTGCALDCSQGGQPGVPGNQTRNSDKCQDVQPWVDCRTQTFDLMDNCKDADRTIQVDGAAPGVDKIAETAGYQRADVPTLIPNANDGHVDVRLLRVDYKVYGIHDMKPGAEIGFYFPVASNTITKEAKYDIFYDGEKVMGATSPSMINAPAIHNSVETILADWLAFPMLANGSLSIDWVDDDDYDNFLYYASDKNAVDRFTIALSSP